MDSPSSAIRKVRGFTLIELVVVITILGILAAFAVPRFIALQTEARASTIKSLSGALLSASSMTHAMWMITGGASVQMDGATIPMASGYPTYTGIPLTLVDASSFSYDSSTGQFSATGVTNPAACSATYTPPASGGSAPSVIWDVSGC